MSELRTLWLSDSQNLFIMYRYVEKNDFVSKFPLSDSLQWMERVKIMPDEASLRQDSLRQDSLRQRVAYRAPGFERSCAQNGRKPHWGKSARAPDKILLKNYMIFGI